MADNMSFLPEDYLAKRVARRTNIICITLFVVVMVGVATALFVTDRQRSEIRAEQALVDQKFEEAARRLEQLEQLQAQKAQMIRKAKVAQVLVEKVPRTVLLAELVNNMPAQLSLLDFELKTETRRETARPRTALDREKGRRAAASKASAAAEEIKAPETDVKLKLTGLATTDVDVAQFIQAVSNHPLFTDASLLFSEQTVIDEKEMRKFAMEAKLAQDADLTEIRPESGDPELKMDPMGDQIQIAPGGVGQAPVSAVTDNP